MPFTMRERLTGPFARRAALVLGIGLLLGFAGPFGSYPPLSAPIRYAFWIGMAFAGYAAALAAERLVPEASIPRPELRLFAVAIASALPLTFVAAWAVSFVRPGHAYQPWQLPALFAAVAAVQLAIVFTLLRKPGSPPLPAPAQAEIDQLSAALPPLKRTLERIETLDPNAQDARRLMSIHLPGLIDRYLHVPPAYRSQQDGEGMTVDERLVEALSAGRVALSEISEKLARADMAAFETQGRFIKSRYGEEKID